VSKEAREGADGEMSEQSEWNIYMIDHAIPEFLNLPPGLQGKMFALFEYIEEVGLLNISPKRRKHIKGDIWEFRVSALEGIARALYFTKVKDVIVLVVFVKKTEGTPIQFINLAETRSREV
jgi:phage-related protein